MTETVVIDRRFSGPTNSGNGGYVCGLLAGAIEGMAKVSQRVQAGSQNIVLGWETGRKGRKRYAGTAVFNETGILCTQANATWIELTPQQT